MIWGLAGMIGRSAASAAKPGTVKPWPLPGRLLAWAVIIALIAPWWRIDLIVLASVVLVLPLAVVIGKHSQGKQQRDQGDSLDDLMRKWSRP